MSEELGIDLKDAKNSCALLVGVYSKEGETLCHEHLDELEELANTFGVPTAARVTAHVRKIEASTYVGSGKLSEISDEIAEKKPTLVIFDEEISPAQQRNLEKALKVAVMDRTELILEIFAQRAQTKEAKLQIELAQTRYEFPRLKRLWSHFSRQRASGGFLKGEGEKQIEIDKRLLKKKIEKLERELKTVKKQREIQSAKRKRSNIPTFAIVGYTNAGKSTLLNALTEAEVLVEDKLFATLDPTTRKFTLPNQQEVLLSDTVGFIRKLPHTLVAAFRSTLEAALHDDILLHVVDASHPAAVEHVETTKKLLEDLGANKNVITVLNKIDACENPAKLKVTVGRHVQISALQKEGFEELADRMMQELSALRKTVKVRIPQANYELVTLLHREGNVHFEEYEENDVVMMADIPLPTLHKFEPYFVEYVEKE
ncbi:MAG: GTPase HflX [Chlamydiales bacterium]|nr:GTPase HflX [Chlamydiales bacterium]